MSTELAAWRHPTTGMPITFQDLRPAALHDQPVKATGTLTATPIPVLPHTMVEVADHEGRHAAAASLFGFKMTEARADAPSDNLYGHVRLDLTDEHWTPLRLAQVMVIALVGDMGEENWPPSGHPTPTPTAQATTNAKLPPSPRHSGSPPSNTTGSSMSAARSTTTPRSSGSPARTHGSCPPA